VYAVYVSVMAYCGNIVATQSQLEHEVRRHLTTAAIAGSQADARRAQGEIEFLSPRWP
jgi:hypothetical protein